MCITVSHTSRSNSFPPGASGSVKMTRCPVQYSRICWNPFFKSWLSNSLLHCTGTCIWLVFKEKMWMEYLGRCSDDVDRLVSSLPEEWFQPAFFGSSGDGLLGMLCAAYPSGGSFFTAGGWCAAVQHTVSRIRSNWYHSDIFY